MLIGDLDEVITLQSYTASQTAYGDKSKTWGSGSHLWAHVIYKSSKDSEKFTADQLVTKTVVIFTIRYNTTPTNRDRIYYNSKYFQITDVVHIGRQKWTQVFTEEFN